MKKESRRSSIKGICHSAEIGRCVLYILSPDQQIPNDRVLVVAQGCAIDKNLPLAVVFCLQETSSASAMKSLKNAEAYLDKFDIPFMVLIGDPYARLKATFYHLEPDTVYFDSNFVQNTGNVQEMLSKEATCNMFAVVAETQVVESGEIIKHPVSWPGRVQKIDELAENFDINFL